MSNEPISLTVKELSELLAKYPEETRVYVSRDAEGNGYNSLGVDSFEYSSADKAVALYPFIERLDYDEVFPREWDKEVDRDERSVD